MDRYEAMDYYDEDFESEEWEVEIWTCKDCGADWEPGFVPGSFYDQSTYRIDACPKCGGDPCDP